MECDGCTLCCELLPVPWMNSPAGELCKHCDEGKGCKIYNTAPKECLEFRCAYNQMEKVSINMRPDKCGVIFERIGSDIFFGTIRESEDNPQKIVEDQVKVFLNDGYSIVLHHMGTKQDIIIPSQGLTKQQVFVKLQKEINK